MPLLHRVIVAINQHFVVFHSNTAPRMCVHRGVKAVQLSLFDFFFFFLAGSDSYPQYGDVNETGSASFSSILIPRSLPPLSSPLLSLPLFIPRTLICVHYARYGARHTVFIPNSFMYSVFISLFNLPRFLIALSRPAASLS